MVPECKVQVVPETKVMTYKTYTCERVRAGRTILVRTGDWKVERDYVPGPIVQKCCQLPGTWHFDPCTCSSHYCPGPTISYPVQCPGRWVCRQVWCPRVECRKVTCTPYVRREHTHCVPYTTPRYVPYTVLRPETYTTCRMVTEQHCRVETRRRCYYVPEEKVQYIPYT